MARPYAAASAAALSLLIVQTAFGQTYHDLGGTAAPGVVPVGGDGSGPLFTTSNPGKVSGAFSASLSGFAPTPSYSFQSVTTASAAYPLPVGAGAVFYNTGSNPITVKLGGSSVSVAAGQADVIQPNSWMGFTVGSSTSYAVVGNGGSSTVVVSGGAGLPTGGAGGGSTGAGGTVTQGSNGSAAAAWYSQLVQGGSLVGASNGLHVQPASGSTFAVSGSLGRSWSLTAGSDSVSAVIAGTPTVSVTGTPGVAVTSEVGAGATSFAVPSTTQFAGMNVGGALTGMTGTTNGLKVDGSAVTQPVSIGALPALSAGSNTIGAVTISGTPNIAVTSEVGVGATSSAVPTTAHYAGMSVGGALTGLTGTANGLKVDGSAVTQPVSGSVSVSGSLPAFATTPTFNLGTAPSLAVTQSGAWSTGRTWSLASGSDSIAVSQPTASALNATIVGVGAAGAPSGGVVSMQGVAGGQPVPITGTVSASIGGFAPTPAYATPLSVSTTSSRVAAPTGTVAVVYNVGSTDAYVTVGGSSVTAATSGDVVKAGGWMAFTLGSNTYIAAITSSGTTTLNISGGAGIATGSGGSSSGGAGTVAQGNQGSAAQAWYQQLVQGGSAIASGNGLYVQPATGASFAVSGSLGRTWSLSSGSDSVTATISGTPSVSVTSEIGTGSTGSTVPSTAQYAGMNVSGNLVGMTGTTNGLKVDGSAVTQPVSGSVSITGSLPGFASTPAVSISGTPNVAVTSEIGAGSTGSAVPTGAQYAGMSVGGTLTGLSGTANGLKVDGSAVTQPVSIASLPALATGSNTIGAVTVSGTPSVSISGTPSVSVSGNPVLGSGTNAIGSVNVQPVSGSGWTAAVKAALGASAVSVKASAGSLGVTHCDNGNTATVYVEFFNTSSVTLGTTSPSWVVPVPAGGGGEALTSGVNLGGSSIYVAAVTAYNGSTAPSTTLNCSIGYI
jgi:hypothetical protein